MNEIELMEAYADTLYKPLRGALGALRAEAERENIPIILKSTEMFLRSMIDIKKPAQILEIGTAVGYSAACFAEKSKTCKVTSIELDEEMCKKAISNFEDLYLSERITVFCGDGEEIIKDSLAGQKFDFVFIDAAKSHYRRFFDAAVTVCTDDAVIISDDVILRGVAYTGHIPHRHRTNVRSMREYIAYLMSLNYAETSILPIGEGIAVTVFKKRFV